ncbi:rhodanese-like domain-containing protein [Flammeovirgaceae bacterium SG7u.111]|nr:rhodanese-like domain-containing protein [Flammeovirgaceae bacterium SG7u.132]WPO36627.1 rhodanese-like domain-containing protein [Flammeovirgaceae bacterium SG7u.111]
MASFQNLPSIEFEEAFGETENAVLLDVRTPEEVEVEHIPGAIAIDFRSPDFADKVSGLEKDKSYFVYCRSGARSASACELMASQGFGELYNLHGGILGWHGDTEEGAL